MTDRNAMYERFLDQLHALEEFRQVHDQVHPTAPIDRDDPAVRRIIEALAFFTARTQTAARANLRASLDRLLAGYFDFLLSPMPAMATVQPGGTERLIEPTTLPEATEVQLGAPDGAIGGFRTLNELPLLPARLEGAEVLLRPDGFRLLVHLRALSPVRALAGPIALRVDYLDRYVASLRLLHQLGRHLQGVSAFFDVRPTDAQRGRACEVALGAAATGAIKSLNPLERLRLLLHYPELELFIHVSVPSGHKPWTRLVLAFDLDSKWPDSRAIASEPFQLQAVPVVNLRRAPAAVIAHDGLKLEHPILPNEVHRDCALHSVAGVFELKQEGLSPLAPAALPGSDEGYELDRVELEGGPKHRLRLRLHDAFAKPRNVVVQAEWHQPWFAARAVGPLTAWLPNRHFEAVKWRVIGGVRAAAETPVYDMSSGLLELLAMRMKPTLTRAELVLLLQLLGAGDDSPFAPLLAKIRTFTVEVSPDGGVLGGGARYRYRLKLDAIAPADEALAWTLVGRIRELCDAWTVGGAVSVEVEMESAEEPSPTNRARASLAARKSSEEER